MAYQSLGLGTTAGDGTGDEIRVGGDKINDNFVELYTLLGTGSALTSGISSTSTVVTLASPSITGVASFADGSVSAPAIANIGDSNTGIYFGAADTVNVTTGGTKRVDIDSSGLDVTGAITATTSITATAGVAGTTGTFSAAVSGTTITATTAFVPDAQDGAALGTTSLQFSDLFLADSAVLGFGDDNDTTLTHTDGSGLTLNSTNKIMFNDASQFIHGSSATVLSIGATDEIDLTATAVDLNGTLNVSGTLAQVGVATFTARDVHSGGITIANAGQIGSVGDADSIAIASNGVVTFSQIPVLPANSILIANLVDDSITEAKMADDAISSVQLKTLSTLLIKNSGGSTLATFHTAGA